MQRSVPWVEWIRTALALVVWLAALGCGLAHAQLIELRDARVTVNGRGQSETVHLPYRWDREHPGQQGEAVFDFHFELNGPPPTVWGIYLPRLGNAYAIWLNGTLLQHQGELPEDPADNTVFNGDDFARVPRFITVDSGHFKGVNHLRIHIRADMGRRGGLAPPVIGPQEQVLPLYAADYRWRVTGSVVVAALSLLVGLTALMFWGVHRGLERNFQELRREPLYLFAAVSQIMWAIYVGDVLVESPPFNWPLWGVLQVVALGIWAFSMVLVCLEVAGWGAGRPAKILKRWFLAMMLACPLVALAALGYGKPFALTAWYFVYGVSLAIFTFVFLFAAWRQPGIEVRLVAVAALVCSLVALRDIYVFRFAQAYAENTLLRYASLGFGIAFMSIVVLRFRATSAQLHELHATQASRLAARESELRTSYNRLESLAREQERTAERSRILRNMHDGVGAHLSSAIRQLQANSVEDLRRTRAEVLATLQDALDQLKLNIDAMHLAPGDVTALLANLRYRLEPRFAAMGIGLQWDVDLLPDCDLDAGAMRELQFMLFEALSNVLQHAQAHTLRIEAHVRDAQVLLRVVDDGRGFDPERDARRGLASLRERAQAIHAGLALRSQPGQTVVEIGLAVSDAG